MSTCFQWKLELLMPQIEWLATNCFLACPSNFNVNLRYITFELRGKDLNHIWHAHSTNWYQGHWPCELNFDINAKPTLWTLLPPGAQCFINASCFYAPGLNDRGHIVLSCLSVCLFLCLLSTLTFAITF